MNKKRIAITIITVIIIALIILPLKGVKAQSINSWNVNGPNAKLSSVILDLTAIPTPTWLQLTSKELQFSTSSEICFPFRNGQYHWEGQILQLINNIWVKQKTFLKRIPNDEGQLMACAHVQNGGTYALHQYYKGPKESYYQPPSAATVSPTIVVTIQIPPTATPTTEVTTQIPPTATPTTEVTTQMPPTATPTTVVTTESAPATMPVW